MVQYDQQGRKQESVTYSEAAARVDALGAWLHGLGLQKGDRVAIGARNFVEWPVCYFGVASAGFVLSALNAW